MPARQPQRPYHRPGLGLLLVCLLNTSYAFFRHSTTTTLGSSSIVSTDVVRQQQRAMCNVALAVREGKEGDAKCNGRVGRLWAAPGVGPQCVFLFLVLVHLHRQLGEFHHLGAVDDLFCSFEHEDCENGVSISRTASPSPIPHTRSSLAPHSFSSIPPPSCTHTQAGKKKQAWTPPENEFSRTIE